ncbi:MAG TPA: nucleoside-diphosphate kinase [Candidatus Paceibacterota bacterium]
MHPKKERTLVFVKPDGVQRSLVGEIIGRFERIGLKMVALKMAAPSLDFVEKHCTLDSTWKHNVGTKSIKAYTDKGEQHPAGSDPLKVADIILNKLKKYLTSGPVVVMVLEGAHAVSVVRKLVGSTEPLSSDVGTIRGDFVLDSYFMSDVDKRAVRNLIHASGSPAEAEMEIAHWFSKDEVIDYRHVQEKILYDVNMDGKTE